MLHDVADVTQPMQGGAQARRWTWTVLVLALCHAAAVAAFQVLNILVEPIKAALDVTDTQYSLMQGLAVAIFAALLGVPAARIADRGNRRRVILVGVITWSAASLACGVAHNSTQLFAARVLVGIGEAFLYPSALSMIADVAPPNRLATAIGVFGCGGPIGTALALIGGGLLLDYRRQLLWGLPSSEVWRAAFILCGAFGALAAGLLVSVAEPPRLALHAEGHGAAVASHLRRHWRAFAGVSTAMLALSYCVFAISSWSPTMLERDHGMSYASIATVTGLGALLGALGAWMAGVVTDRIESSGHRDAPLLVALGVAVLIAATTLGAVLTSSGTLASLFVCITYSLLGMPTVLGATALQEITPAAIRAQILALQVLLVNLLALSLGPLTVAITTDYLFRQPAAVGYSLALANSLGALGAIGAILVCRRRFMNLRM